MEPFRPFIADKLGDSQRTLGFAIQSFFIGAGAAFANVAPYILRFLGVTDVSSTGVPHTVKYAFQFGAIFLLATVLWTIITSKEDPPADLEALRERQRSTRGLRWLKEFFTNVLHMPQTMKQFAVVQVFTWLGMFCMFMFFAPAVARHVFQASNPRSLRYNEGIEWAGVALGTYSVVSIGASLLLPRLVAMTSRRIAHALCLTCGGLCLLSLYLVQNQYLVLLIMVGVGIAWASIHAMPYAILSSILPRDKMGAFMGMFSFFIAVPGIIASLTFRPLVKYVFDNNPLYLVMLGGLCFLIAAVLMVRVLDPLERKQSDRIVSSLQPEGAYE
jgi:maltose/moltooligosaccharide transporter